MKPFNLAIVGLPYPNQRGVDRRFEAQICAPGEAIELRPEPNNKYDRWAVAAYSCRGVQIGYVTAEKAQWIGGMIREGRQLTVLFLGLNFNTAWVRVGLDGQLPDLPLQRLAAPLPDDSGFFPDPTYDDD
jgi:hypothetical protein